IRQKSCELAMYGPSRPDAFHDLLPDITPLTEVKGPVLLRLLRQIPLADIDAIGGDAGLDPLQFKSLESNGGRACRQQGVPQLPYIFSREPDLIIVAFAANQRAIDSLPRARLNLQALHLRHGQSAGRQHISRPWAADPQRSQILAEILHFDIIHDDVVIEGGENLLRL